MESPLIKKIKGEEIVCENMKIFYKVQGERRFFRVCYHWLAVMHPESVEKTFKFIPLDGYGRWDDLYTLFDTPLESKMLAFLEETFINDVTALKKNNQAISLLGKWAPSINASSSQSKEYGLRIANYLKLNQREYRKMLSALRERIKIVERLMSQNRWDEIDFSKLPSRAGLMYSATFAQRPETAERYKEFMESKNTKVNAGTLYPYDVVHKALTCPTNDRAAINKYWENLTDYFNNQPLNALVVCDTSGSMTWGDANAVRPIDIAISLALYAADKAPGPFHNYYISFSRVAQLVETSGYDFVDKARRIEQSNVCENTNLESVFDLILTTAMRNHINPATMPDTLIVVSDMEVDDIMDAYGSNYEPFMDSIRKKWMNRCGGKYAFPKLVYWNVAARKDTFIDNAPGITFVSGASPILFQQIMSGKTAQELMRNTLDGERYQKIGA